MPLADTRVTVLCLQHGSLALYWSQYFFTFMCVSASRQHFTGTLVLVLTTEDF